MIYIVRTPKPLELTDEVVDQKTALFKSNPKARVWNEKYIRDALLEMSHHKCCYCECDLSKESNFMEVEHFHHKDKYPDEVVLWENLLPSCKKCNDHKGSLDTRVCSIINPTLQKPQRHMYFHAFTFRGIDDLGTQTVACLHLNDYKRHCMPRFEIGIAIQEKIAEKLSWLPNLHNTDKSGAYWHNKLVNSFKELLRSGLPTEPYSATVATVMLHDPKYSELKQALVAESLWDQEMTDYEKSLQIICYEEHP